jgi:hypothetical protein
VNVYDKASRYAAHLDAAGFLRWLMPDLPAAVSYNGWLDTRTLPFPGEADRTCDTVACFHDGVANEWWAVPVEFQIEPDGEMFGRFMEFLGRLWREQRPAADGTARYKVGAAVVNLTGRGAASRDMVLGPAGSRTHLQVIERNFADEDAGATLAGIAEGRIARAMLPWIPLMRDGGEPGIIEQWKELALAEPDSRRRAEYGALALVFAEPVGRRPLWKQALEKWNMIESQQVLEWMAEGEAKGELRGELRGKLQVSRTILRELLEDRFGALPEALTQRIEATTDPEQLLAAARQVSHLGQLDDLQW